MSEKPWKYGYNALREALKTSMINRNVFKKFTLNVLKYKENREIFVLYSIYRFPAGYAKVIDIAKEKRKSQRFLWTCCAILSALVSSSLFFLLILTLIAVIV